MPLNFTFALSQQQTFELRCDYGSRRLDKAELAALIDLCEQNYYAQQKDSLPYLTQLGRQLYQWLDGKEGWLRKSLDEADEQTILLDLIKTSEAKGLNPETERVALGLAHLPWELLHDGAGFLLQRQNISVLPVRSVQQRQTPVIGVQNRPLRLLLMATSPEDPRVPPLGFEQEEANILQATKEQPLAIACPISSLFNSFKSYSAYPTKLKAFLSAIRLIVIVANQSNELFRHKYAVRVINVFSERASVLKPIPCIQGSCWSKFWNYSCF